MVVFSREFHDVSKSVTSKIDRLYQGVAIPNIDKIHICAVSSCTDTNLMSLYIYWSMMVQNVYSTDFKCIIVSSDTNSESPADTLMQSVDSIGSSEEVKFFDKDVTDIVDVSDLSGIIKDEKSKKTKHNKRATLLAISDTCQSLEKLVAAFRPHMIIFDEFKIEKEMIVNITNYLDSVKQFLHTSVVALTKYPISEDDLKTLPQLEIVYTTSTCFEKMIENNHPFYIKLIKLDDITDHGAIVAKLDSVLEDTDIIVAEASDLSLKKRILVVSKDRVTSDDLFEKYREIYEDFSTVGCIHPFNGADEKDVLRFADLDDDDSSAIFVSSGDLVDVYDISENALKNIDGVIVLDPNFKNDSTMYQKVATNLVLNTKRYSTLLYVEVMNEPVYQQIHRVTKLFYDSSSTNVQMFNEIIDSIDSKRITFDCEENGKTKKEKAALVENLEEVLEITDRDKKFNIRHDIVYIVNVPKSKGSQIRIIYDEEEELIRSKLTDVALTGEFEAIFEARKGARNVPHYSGPKWVSVDNSELQGSKIGFAHEDRDTIEVCEILGVRTYTRREKRPSWKEKDCKNKNVLYLSSLKAEYKLSAFKKQFKIPTKEKIENMREFEFDFQIK